jgi:hypothetical protein
VWSPCGRPDPQTTVTLADAGQQLPAAGETALVWRQGFKPQLRAAMAGECAWIVDLLAGRPLTGWRTTQTWTSTLAAFGVSTGLLLGVSQAPYLFSARDSS